jgi:hypothetical protein
VVEVRLADRYRRRPPAHIGGVQRGDSRFPRSGTAPRSRPWPSSSSQWRAELTFADSSHKVC